MTWRQWVRSLYNYNGYNLSLRESCSGEKKYYLVNDYPCWYEINLNDVIEEGKTYNYICTWNGTPSIDDLHLCS